MHSIEEVEVLRERFRVEKRTDLVDIVSVLQNRVTRGTSCRHIFLLIVLYQGTLLTNISAMIDCEITHNFISQIKIKKLNLKRIDAVSLELKQLDDISLQVYETHFLDIEVKNYESREKRAIYTMIDVNMTSIDMILRLS
jgi:hypothetical protein